MYMYTHMYAYCDSAAKQLRTTGAPPFVAGAPARSISEMSSCFFGSRPWHIEIRHRVKKKTQLICSDFRLSNLKFED